MELQLRLELQMVMSHPVGPLLAAHRVRVVVFPPTMTDYPTKVAEGRRVSFDSWIQGIQSEVTQPRCSDGRNRCSGERPSLRVGQETGSWPPFSLYSPWDGVTHTQRDSLFLS